MRCTDTMTIALHLIMATCIVGASRLSSLMHKVVLAMKIIPSINSENKFGGSQNTLVLITRKIYIASYVAVKCHHLTKNEGKYALSQRRKKVNRN